MTTQEITYLSIHDIIEIHKNLQQSLGGRYGVKDRSILFTLLDEVSIFFKTQKSEDLWEIAAKYICSFAKKKPFIEGNLRTAFVSGIYLLELNGINVNLKEAELEELIKKVKSEEMDVPKVASFLKGEDHNGMIGQALEQVNQMYSDVLKNLAK